MAVWARLCLMSKAAMQHSVTDFKKRGMTFTVLTVHLMHAVSLALQ